MSKASELQAIISVFHNPGYEEWSEEGAADRIRSALLKEWKGAAREAPPVPHQGLAFKFPWSSSARHIAYMDIEYDGVYENGKPLKGIAWITDTTSRYGSLMPLAWDGWSLISRSSAEKGGAGENADGWKVGEVVSMHLDSTRYRIVQTHAKSVLMESSRGALFAEPNDVLEKFRRIA